MTAPTPSRPPNSTWPMYRSMVGIGIVCGLLIVTVFEATAPTISRKRAEALERAIFRVLPEAASSVPFAPGPDGSFHAVTSDAPETNVIHAAYDSSGRLAGLAIEAQGMGYQDIIRVLYGYASNRDAVIGMQVLESRETPGLGDRIESDPDFLRNFVQLDVALTADATALAHPIVAVKHGTKQNPWEVDAITGATISSKAMADLLRQSTGEWIPLIKRRLNDFQQGTR
jgi:H+/Na+-translocating ferredoxin:NAD+ oxidoreductase subunit G